MPTEGNTCIGRISANDNRPKAIKDADPTGVFEADLKRKEAMNLRRKGMSFDDIGEQLGVSGKTARQYVNDGWARIHDETDEDRRVLRSIEADRLDVVVRSCMNLLETPGLIVVKVDAQGNETREVLAREVDMVVKVSDRIIKAGARRSQLYGLDEPQKIEVQGGSTLPSLEELRANIAHSQANRDKACGQSPPPMGNPPSNA